MTKQPDTPALWRRLYTAERLRWLGELDPLSPISDAASFEQARLEAAVFSAFAGLGGYTQHAGGIDWTRQMPDGTICVHMDSTVAEFDCPPDETVSGTYEPGYGVAELVVQSLLPAQKADYFNGAAGVRVAAAKSRDLHLNLIGAESARVTLRAAEWVDWQAILKEHARVITLDGQRPLWEEPKATRLEQRELASYRSHSNTSRLASALLRRVGLFHNVAFAHSISAWTCGPDTWNLEIYTDPCKGPIHQAFLNFLTDPKFGIPLQVRWVWCACGNPERRVNCELTLELTHSMKTKLVLRFVQDPLPRALTWPTTVLRSARGNQPRK
jgi:hypothetical protein